MSNLASSLPAWSLPSGGVVLWLGLVFGLASWLHQRQPGRPELPRKVVHLGTGNVILLAWWGQIPAWVGILAAIVAGTAALVSYWLPILPSINSVGRPSYGTFFYAVSIGVLIAWFWPLGLPQYAALGILVMTWGDGLAALVGQRWGQHRYTLAGVTKSWEGSLTMALVGGGLGGLILWSSGVPQPLSCALLIGVTAAVLEVVSWLGLDNLTVPLGTAGLAYLLGGTGYAGG
ncbi:MAG: phosphatidate cytidylyltransferase [Gloeomargaritaceae cyanobacterium C42_A2020_066]|nr:phosphatidate cytidylyltransferase [Gloeomargaritaceae cyanobacterium C42_A2020_066]